MELQQAYSPVLLSSYLRWISRIAALMIFLGSSTSPASSSHRQSMRSLENKVWTADPDDLTALEYDVTRVIQESPHSAFGHYLLAYLYLREFKDDPGHMGKLKKASELGQQAIDLQPESSYGYIISALVLDIMGYSDNALRLIDPSLNTKIDESWRTKFLKAQLIAGSAPQKETLQLLSEALQSEPSAAEIIAPYAVALLRDQNQNLDKLKEAMDSWSSLYESPIFDHSLAIAYSEAHQYDEAAKLYQQMLRKEPENVDAKINLGILLSEHLASQGKGRQLLKESLQQLSKSHPHSEKLSLVHAQLAKLSLNEKDNANARKSFKSAILASPAPLEWLGFTQAIYSKHREFQQLSLLLHDLKQELPGNGIIYALHGELLSEHLLDQEAAIESYQNAILLEPNRSEFYNGLGLAYYRLKDLNKALSLFNHATKVDPRDATARYNEACVLAILGYSQRALGSLREAISLDPRLQLTAREDSDFSSLRSLRQFEDLVQDRNLSNVSH